MIGILSLCCNSKKNNQELNLLAEHKNILQDESYDKGKLLFKKNCIACHSIEMDKIKTAPALGGVTTRRNKEWLYNYTRRSMEMYKNGDSIAINLRSQGWALMFSFPNLTDDDLDNIYYFVEKKFKNDKNH